VNQASPENPLTVFAPTNTAFVKYIATNPGFFIDTPQVGGRTIARGRKVNNHSTECSQEKL
jgi:hypothetical protein